MVKIMENPIKMDDLGVPLFLETPMFSTKPYLSDLNHYFRPWILNHRCEHMARGLVVFCSRKIWSCYFYRLLSILVRYTFLGKDLFLDNCNSKKYSAVCSTSVVSMYSIIMKNATDMTCLIDFQNVQKNFKNGSKSANRP